MIVAVSTSHPALYIFEGRRQVLICEIPLPPRTPALHVKFVPSNPDLLVVADRNKDMKVWEWRSRQVYKTFAKEHEKVVRAMEVFSTDGDEDRIVTMSSDQSIRIWIVDQQNTKSIASVLSNSLLTALIVIPSVRHDVISHQ